MSDAAPWESFIAEHFPGYLLPGAFRRALSEEAAARFLARVSGHDRQLFLLRAASVLSGRVDDLRELALRQLPRLIENLPPRTEVETREWEGPHHGRLDVSATLKRRLEGRLSSSVLRLPRRRLDRPENALVKVVATRLHTILVALRASGTLAWVGWGEGLTECEVALRGLLSTTALGAVPDQPITTLHEQAALGARHHGYALAAGLHRALREGLDTDDPEAIARVVAEGALLPLDDSTRFELAVLVRLMQSVWERVERREPGRWTFHRTLILPDRREVADFEREGGVHVKFFYNQSSLAPGPHDLGVRRYFDQQGRLRPDITLVVIVPGAAPRAAVVEAKLSSDPDYLVQGYRQALLYRNEYAAQLTGWPKAILVASSPLTGAPRREDDVIAVGWDRWVPEIVLDGLLEGVMSPAP